MRGRGIATINFAVHRYLRASSSLAGSSGRVSSTIVDFSGGSSIVKDDRDGAYGHNFKNMKSDRKLFGIAAGAFSASFAFSSMSAALAKERVVPERMPEEVILYQYEACPFCNKVKGEE